uniref:Uncharacterized protein n=1 Tax=Cannabis sativa TaxID=3483 RepID=A0A803NIP5_CANSA
MEPKHSGPSGPDPRHHGGPPPSSWSKWSQNILVQAVQIPNTMVDLHQVLGQNGAKTSCSKAVQDPKHHGGTPPSSWSKWSQKHTVPSGPDPKHHGGIPPNSWLKWSQKHPVPSGPDPKHHQ